LLDLRIGIEQAFIKALEPPAEQGYTGALGKLANARLGDGRSARREGEDWKFLPGTGRN
jgi:hypothetical protein